MARLIAVAVLTASQFTAFPFFAIVAGNTARHSQEPQLHQGNVTIVYKSQDNRTIETM